MDRKIRVLRIINRFNIGGPTYNATFLSAFLGDEFETLLVGGMPEENEVDSLHIPEFYGLKPLLLPEMKRNPNVSADRLAYKRIKEIINDFKPDIVHTHASKAGALGRRAAYKLKVPIILHTFHGHVFHSYFGGFKTLLIKKIEKKLAKKSTGIIAISEIQKKELSEVHEICLPDKIEIIPLGFDLKRFQQEKELKRAAVRSQYQIAEDEIAIAIIGRLVPIKNHILFLQSLELVFKKTTKNLRIFVVGDGTEKKLLQSFVADRLSNYENKIHFTSWIEDIASFNHGMDLICLSSLNEGTPVSLIEAQAAGIPVISTNVGGVSNVVLDQQTGIIVKDFAYENYADAMLELIENEKKRIFMSQNGPTFVEEKFNYERLVRDTKKYYLNLLAKYETEI